jgi:hypothetical protein
MPHDTRDDRTSHSAVQPGTGGEGRTSEGLTGSAAKRGVDPAVEEAHWREAHSKAPYYQEDRPYEAYAIFYSIGSEARVRYGSRSFEDVEDELKTYYNQTRRNDSPSWEEGRDAVRAAWHRLDRMFPDSD